jgi:hypothetical protein
MIGRDIPIIIFGCAFLALVVGLAFIRLRRPPSGQEADDFDERR